jgi:hypothetical protein
MTKLQQPRDAPAHSRTNSFGIPGEGAERPKLTGSKSSLLSLSIYGDLNRCPPARAPPALGRPRGGRGDARITASAVADAQPLTARHCAVAARAARSPPPRPCRRPRCCSSGKRLLGVPKRSEEAATALDQMVQGLGGDKPIHRCLRGCVGVASRPPPSARSLASGPSAPRRVSSSIQLLTAARTHPSARNRNSPARRSHTILPLVSPVSPQRAGRQQRPGRGQVHALSALVGVQEPGARARK